MTEKEAREKIDAEIRALIRKGVRTAGKFTEELQTYEAAKVLTRSARPLDRVVDQALQRMRRAGIVEFLAYKREWTLRCTSSARRSSSSGPRPARRHEGT